MLKKIKSILILLLINIFTTSSFLRAETSIAPNDPLPIFSTADPHAFMFTQPKEKIRYLSDGSYTCYCGTDHFMFSLSPYYQKAHQARTIDKDRVFVGDMKGRWHMVGLLYGPRPNDAAFQSAPQLCCAQLAIFNNPKKIDDFPTPPCSPANPTSCVQEIPPQNILYDPLHQIGFFSVPLKYRKVGMRFEVSLRFLNDVGVTVQTGVADLKQTLKQFINLTREPANTSDPLITPVTDACTYSPDCNADNENITDCGYTSAQRQAINCTMMSLADACEIFKEINLDISDFQQTGIEDVYVDLWWRHAFCINRCAEDWPEFRFIPFAIAEGCAAVAKKADRLKAFSASLGNDGHSMVGFRFGFDIDFTETIAIDMEAGYHHFFARDVQNVRIPTHSKQSGVFPFYTNVNLQPGNNGFFGAGFHAYRFLDRLSFYLQYRFVTHQRDKITIPKDAKAPFDDPDDNKMFIEQYEVLSSFTSQMINAAFNYEISPHMTLGLAVQAPVSQRNAYRSTTLMGGFTLLF